MIGFIEGTPTAIVKLDRPREIAFTLRSMQLVRELFVDDLEEIDLAKDPQGLELLPAYIWACLDRQGRSELTPEDIAEMIHPGNMEEIASALASLRKRSEPEAKEGNPTQPVAQAQAIEA